MKITLNVNVKLPCEVKELLGLLVSEIKQENTKTPFEEPVKEHNCSNNCTRCAKGNTEKTQQSNSAAWTPFSSDVIRDDPVVDPIKIAPAKWGKIEPENHTQNKQTTDQKEPDTTVSEKTIDSINENVTFSVPSGIPHWGKIRNTYESPLENAKLIDLLQNTPSSITSIHRTGVSTQLGTTWYPYIETFGLFKIAYELVNEYDLHCSEAHENNRRQGGVWVTTKLPEFCDLLFGKKTGTLKICANEHTCILNSTQIYLELYKRLAQLMVTPSPAINIVVPMFFANEKMSNSIPIKDYPFNDVIRVVDVLEQMFLTKMLTKVKEHESESGPVYVYKLNVI